MGERKSIIADTCVPFNNSKSKSVPLVSSTDLWWYCIAEKAFTKAVDRYSSIAGGNQHFGCVIG
jgi:hypothetical protein